MMNLSSMDVGNLTNSSMAASMAAPGNCSSPAGSLAPTVELLLEGLAIPAVGALGLLGNLAAVIVLRSEVESVTELTHWVQISD